MIKTITAILITALLGLASCKKSPNPGGSWTFQGVLIMYLDVVRDQAVL